MSVPEQFEREIVELHEFFVSWMTGQDADFSRFADVLADEFQIVFPDGSHMDREDLLARIQEAKGALEPGTFTIEVKNIQVRPAARSIFIATYEEWQTRDHAESVRLSTAVFRSSSKRTKGVEWIHVHETWVPKESR